MARAKRSTENVAVVDATSVTTERKRASGDIRIFDGKMDGNVFSLRINEHFVPDTDGYAAILRIDAHDEKISVKRKINGNDVAMDVDGYNAFNMDGEFLTDTPMETRQKIAFHALVNEIRATTKASIDATQNERATKAKLNETDLVAALLFALVADDYDGLTLAQYESVKTNERLQRLTDAQRQTIIDALTDATDDDDDDVSETE